MPYPMVVSTFALHPFLIPGEEGMLQYCWITCRGRVFRLLATPCRFNGTLGRNFRGALHYDGGLTNFCPAPATPGVLSQRITWYVEKKQAVVPCISLTGCRLYGVKAASNAWCPSDMRGIT